MCTLTKCYLKVNCVTAQEKFVGVEPCVSNKYKKYYLLNKRICSIYKVT